MSSALLTQLYVGYFNRAPDPEGLDYWEAQLAKGMTPAEIAQSFSVQPESTSNYPYLDDQAANDAGSFIAKIYQNLFNRAPDPEGLAYWTAQLEAGRPVGGFILDVINGARNTEDGQDKKMLENKVSVGQAFNDANQGQTGVSVIDAAKNIMAGVNQSDASVKMALGKISDAASGATTVFNGDHLGDFENGALKIDQDVYTFSNADEIPNTILVTNGADLVADGTIKLGGHESSITVRGEGSSLQVKFGLDDDNAQIGRFTGDTSSLNISDGAEVTYENNLRLGNLRVDGDRGTAGSTSNTELNVLEGGKLSVKSRLEFAPNYEANGDDTGNAVHTTLIQGAGSKVKVDDDLRAGGSGADVTIDVRSGGKLEVQDQLELGFATDYAPDNGGSVTLEIRGQDSVVTANELRGGLNKGSSLSIFADDSAKFELTRAELGVFGGSADIKLSDNATFTTEEADIGRFSGSQASVEISTGASFTASNWMSIGEFHNGKTWDDGGTGEGIVNGHAKVTIDILDGGKFYAQDGFGAATRWEIDPNFDVGDESGTVDITVSGEGSLFEVGDSADFGMSKNAEANLSVLDGGTATFVAGAYFGQNSDQHEHFGGTGTLTVSGEGSRVEFQTKDPWDVKFGTGQATEGKLSILDNGSVTANGIRAGRDGGKGEILVDGGSLFIQYTGADAEKSMLGIGDHASNETSSLTVTGGGKVTIDGSSKNSPELTIGRDEGAKGQLSLSGVGSTIEFVNDNPRNSPDQPDFGNGSLSIGYLGEGNVSISDGAVFNNTDNGFVSVATKDGASGSLSVSGEGTIFNYGGAMLVGGSQGSTSASVSFTNGAVINNTGNFETSKGNTWDGIYIDDNAGSTLTIDGTTTVNSNLEIYGGNFVVSETAETVTLNGKVLQVGGEIDLQIAGTSSHDKLVITESAELKGELNIAFEGGYSGAVGDSFELFTATSFDVGGDFALDISGLAAGLDAQLQVSDTVASLVIFDSEVADFAIV